VLWQNNKRSILTWGLFQAIAYFVLALPSLVIIGASFNPGSALTFPPHGLTLAWYVRAIETPALPTAFS
jgi:putative spermidine/putrescine transport system permease protein